MLCGVSICTEPGVKPPGRDCTVLVSGYYCWLQNMLHCQAACQCRVCCIRLTWTSQVLWQRASIRRRKVTIKVLSVTWTGVRCDGHARGTGTAFSGGEDDGQQCIDCGMQCSDQYVMKQDGGEQFIGIGMADYLLTWHSKSRCCSPASVRLAWWYMCCWT